MNAHYNDKASTIDNTSDESWWTSSAQSRL